MVKSLSISWILAILVMAPLFGQGAKEPEANVRPMAMDVERLVSLIRMEADTVSIEGNSIAFMFNGSLLVCIHDARANRMRIIAPITERSNLEEEDLLNALVANFHTALDVKYALSDEIIWSVYAHPLRELTDAQLIDAIQQVYAAAITFGDSFSSTTLVFPGNTLRKEENREDSDRKFRP